MTTNEYIEILSLGIVIGLYMAWFFDALVREVLRRRTTK